MESPVLQVNAGDDSVLFYYFKAAVCRVLVTFVLCLFFALELNEKTCGIGWH